MDRSEAIKILEGFRYYIIHEDTNEALDLAIEALGVAESATTTDCNYTCSDCKHQDKAYEQEPCYSCFNNDGAGYEPDTDCISRADTIKAMCRECKVFPDDVVNCADCTEVAIVKGMPTCNQTCNQKQVTGKLKNPDDSLLTDDSEACKEQKSKLDCISRADLPKELNGVVLDDCDKIVDEFLEEHECDELWNVVRALRDFYDWTMDAPPVTPTERTGEWIEDGYYDSPFRICSYCGYEHQNQRGMWKFCPNCGAKMKGGTENE